MRTHDTGKRTLIRNRQRRVPKRPRPLDQLLRLRSAAQEAEVRETVQLGVVAQTCFCRVRRYLRFFSIYLIHGDGFGDLFYSRDVDQEIPVESVTVSSKFQAVIPKQARKALKLSPGRKVQVVVYENRLELIPVRLIKKMRGFLRGIKTK